MSKVSASIVALMLFTMPFYGCASMIKQEIKVEPIVEKAEIKAPVALIVPNSKVYGTDTYIDNYFWLRNKVDPSVISYLNEENQYSELKLKPTEKLQEDLYKEMLGRIKEADSSVPEKIGNYYYYNRTEPGKQYKIYCRKYFNLDGIEEVILDLNVLAQDKKYFALGTYKVSPNGKYVAYSTDTDGSESYTLYIKEIQTSQILTDIIPNTSDSLEWSNDSEMFFYTVLDATKRPYQAYRHRINGDYKSDIMVYQENDGAYFLNISKTKSKSYLLFKSASNISSETRYISANKPNGVLNLVIPRKYGVDYSVESRDNKLYILTNDNAPNYKLVIAPFKNPSEKNWREIIPQWETVKMDDIQVFKNFIVISEREDATKKVLVINMKNFDLRHIDFPEAVYNVELNNNNTFDTNILRFNYESMTTPPTTFDYNMEANTRTQLKQREVLGGYDPNKYESEKVFVKATDGAMIPVSLVHKKNFVKDGKSPLLMYGYGSYGINTDPYFSSTNISLLDRGFTYAIANVRGGSELGKKWYESGKFLNKKNTFNDFINVAEYLVKEKYTSSDKLVAQGGSAGGMLMGAIANMRPDLFKTIIAQVPFVDVINTMMDSTLPLTTTEYDEWGDPNKKEYYDYMKSYSPYDNVKIQAYPNMLVTAGLNDPRVGYWEPAKFVAKLRANKTDKNTLILKTNMGAGHGGASGRYDYLKDVAYNYAFILDTLGINDIQPAVITSPLPLVSPLSVNTSPLPSNNSVPSVSPSLIPVVVPSISPSPLPTTSSLPSKI